MADSPSAEEDSAEAAADDSEPTTNDPPDADVDSQQLRLVNMSANSFENSEPFRWNVEPTQVSGIPMPSIDLSQPPSQQPPLTIKHYDPNGEKEPIIRSTPNLQPYVTVEQFPFKDVAKTPIGEGSVGIAITPDSSAAATTMTIATLTVQDEAASTGHTPYPDAGVFRHYVVPPKDKDALASQPILKPTPVPVADSGPSTASATDSVSAPPAPPTQNATQPVGTKESATPSTEKPQETSASAGKKKTASSTKSKPKSKGKGKAADPPSRAEAPAQPPLPPQPSLYPYPPYYLFPPAQYAQYTTAGAYGLMYPPLHPSAPVPESISTSKAKGKGTKGKKASSISAPPHPAPHMPVHPYTYPLAHLPYPYSALVPSPHPPGGPGSSAAGQAIPPAPAFYYPPPYPYAASAPPAPGLGVPPPPSSLVPSYQTVSGGTVSAPVDGLAPGTAAATSISAPPAAAPPPPTKARQPKKAKEPKSLFNYYHPGYGTTDSPELPAGAEPGKRKRRKIDPAWLEKMRLRAEEEKRAAAGDATESASAGPSASADASGSASGVVTSVPSTHVGIDVDAELVSAISSAHESEAEVEQCLDHAQEQEQTETILDDMDEDDPHVDETSAPEVSSSRLSEREEHGSPNGNAQSKPCYNKTCRRRVVSTSATGSSTFCDKCKAKFKKHAEKNRVIMDPHVDDDVEKGPGSPGQNEKELPDPRFEQRTERESGLIVEEPEEIQSPGPGAQEVNTRFQEQVQELQHELSDFLAQHVARTLNLQNSLHNEPLKLRKHSSAVMHERDNTLFCDYPASVVTPPSSGNIAVYHQDPLLSRLDIGITRPTPLDLHNDALARFLSMHMSNLQALQNSLLRTHGKPPTISVDGRGGVDSLSAGSSTMQEYADLVATSALEAIFIIAVLAFAYSIIGPQKHRIPFSVAMLFSFFSLSFLMLCLCLSLWGFLSASWRRLKHEPESQVQVNFYLFLGRQLQFCALSAFMLPLIMLTFYIFSGIAFPIVHLVFLLVASLLVLGSVVYRVPISLENVSSIVLSTRHMERPSLRPISWNVGRRRSIY
ncbi:hypothetical protein EST38_g4276 [Candolleomyces aberdarensis]|uniref:Uncharacterized protein n=1 Tax=Candolleomyces aberdarensis TaxID=2316362 RepID=A0A4Q2DRF3_9AGAR|nr:hypothetical protein EST38_g4276 [Candolleomyces aberdarensis]